MLHALCIKYEKIKILEKLFRKNKTSPLLKTPEKDFHLKRGSESEDGEKFPTKDNNKPKKLIVL